MTITEGHYRGAHCTVTLIPDTAQVVVSVDYANHEDNNLSIRHVDGPDHPWRHDPYTFKDIKALAGGESYLSSGEFILLDDLREDFFVDKDGGHDFDTIISEKFMKLLSRPQD